MEMLPSEAFPPNEGRNVFLPKAGDSETRGRSNLRYLAWLRLPQRKVPPNRWQTVKGGNTHLVRARAAATAGAKASQSNSGVGPLC